MLAEVEATVLKLVQQEALPKEFEDLRNQKHFFSRSKVVSLSPFVDSNAVMRAKASIRRAKVSYGLKQCLVLPSKHREIELYLNYPPKVVHHKGVHYIGKENQKFQTFALGNALPAVKHNCARHKKFSS